MSVLLWQHNKPCQEGIIAVYWDTRNDQSHPSGIFLLALSLRVTVMNTFAWIFLPSFVWLNSLLCQTTLFIPLHEFTWKCFYSSGKHPSICCASATAHEGGKFTGEFMLNNSCPFPFAGDGCINCWRKTKSDSALQNQHTTRKIFVLHVQSFSECYKKLKQL